MAWQPRSNIRVPLEVLPTPSSGTTIAWQRCFDRLNQNVKVSVYIRELILKICHKKYRRSNSQTLVLNCLKKRLGRKKSKTNACVSNNLLITLHWTLIHCDSPFSMLVPIGTCLSGVHMTDRCIYNLIYTFFSKTSFII